jgi:hypothetical protein
MFQPTATGQGWAAAGILRVYQTIAKSPYRATMEWALPDLCNWAEEIVAAVWQHQQPDGSLNNYLDSDDSFQDMSSTAFMAAVTYRLALITDATDHIPAADKAFALVKEKVDATGKLQNVVNPYDFSTPYDDVSPEGQAMVLMLQAAYRDYQNFSNNINSSITDVVSNLFGCIRLLVDSLCSSSRSPTLSLLQRVPPTPMPSAGLISEDGVLAIRCSKAVSTDPWARH